MKPVEMHGPVSLSSYKYTSCDCIDRNMAILRSLVITRNIRPCIGKLSRSFSMFKDRHSKDEEHLIEEFKTSDGRPRIAGRPFLPGGDGHPMPKYLKEPSSNFPYRIDMTTVSVIGTRERTLEELTAEAKSVLQQKVRLHGAVLLEGLPLRDGNDFSKFNRLLGYRPMKYEGGVGDRNNVAKDVMTASNDPPGFTIECHNEMSYCPRFPLYFVLFVETPPRPGCGGESVLADVRTIQRELDADVVAKFKRLGVKISHFVPHEDNTDYISWQEVFMTDSASAVEHQLSASGDEYQWTKDKSLRYWRILPATRPHHETGEEIWFNQAHTLHASYHRAHPDWGSSPLPDDQLIFHTYYGDGSTIEPEVLQHIRDVTWKNAVGLQLKKATFFFSITCM